MGTPTAKAAMRHQVTTDGSFSEADAMRLVRSLGLRSRTVARDEAKRTRRTAITRTVEEQVIPRLLTACQACPPAPAAMTGDVNTLTQLLLDGSQPEAAAFVAQAGLGAEQLLLNLLTPAAQNLGSMWAEDSCSFADVTIGMVRLANVMRLVGHAFESEAAPVQCGPRALLVQAPGEQHGFGVAMVACFFRRAGWNVVTEPVADRAALVSLVRAHWFSLVGLSVACADRLEGVAGDIRAIRAASRNPSIGVMVGGFAFTEQPHNAALVGADCTAPDARLAVQKANALVSQLACGA